MSCSFSIYWVQIPEGKKLEVENRLVLLGLDHVLRVDEVKGEYFVEESQDDMNFSTATDITDNWLPELAKILQGRVLDGQIVETECEGEKTNYLLCNGQSTELPNFLEEITPENAIPVGTTIEAVLKVKLVGLMNGKAGVLEFVFDKTEKR